MRAKQPYTLTREQLRTTEEFWADTAKLCADMLDNEYETRRLERLNPVAASVLHEAILVLERLQLTLGAKQS